MPDPVTTTPASEPVPFNPFADTPASLSTAELASTPAAPTTSVASQTPPSSLSTSAAPATPATPITPARGPVGPELGTEPQGKPAVTLTQEQLKELIAAGRQPAQPAQHGQPQMTDAEFKKAFNIYEATDADYEALLGVKPDNPGRVAKLNEVLQNIARQSVTINRYLMDQKANEFNRSVQPLQENARQAQEREYITQFQTTYSDLKDYTPLLREIVTAGAARGMKFADPQSAMKYVAETAYKLLGRTPGQVQSPTTTQPAQQPASRQMSTTSVGGRSGSSGSATPPATTAERLFSGT